ncbi:cell wall-binding repeat-containing protein [Miniphocaeibacter halophilus]|uniref:Cell wall-binding repeat-containing protein n=1 Tax=Miniphocaeibacter halophilus TaxID=2931922 RepID=A0AC61MQ40_9FIRM|nr:cell wall-binding repeat-containing protein [Miniphocaeibacter halophilus]QQK07732.1 cell wall-binding repeat-containing protein [Miniphocaeibacter halophilus]
MKKKVLSLMLALTFTFSSLLPATSLADNKKLNVKRIAGSGRYETAVEASKKTFERSKYAVVASGEKFADALVGGTLATQIEAPVLLVNKNSVPSVVTTEIKRLEVEKVYLLGGTSTVENSLKQLGVSVERLAGRNKAYTAQEIAKARAKHLGIDTNWTEFAAIDANNYADALSAAPFVSQLNYFIPLIPIEKGNTSSAHTVALGGTNSVTKSTTEKKRYAGSNREGTAVEIAKAYEEELNKEINTVVLVHGYDYPDALASAPVASMNNGVILLTNSKTLSKETKSFIDNNDNIKNVIIVGGENSVSKNIERELRGEVITPIENNFDKLDIKLQAFLITSIADERVFEFRNLDYMEFYFDIKGNNIYTYLTSGVGSGHPINKFTINIDTIIYKNSIVARIEETKVYDGKNKTVTKKELYDEYLKYKNDYDVAATKIKFSKEIDVDLIRIVEDSIK